MRQIFYFAIFLSILGVYSCGSDKKKDNKPSLEELKKRVNVFEDSLNSKQKSNQSIVSLEKIELINRLLDIYHNYPENDLSASCLDKVHMIYSGLGAYDRSAAYADTLLTKYPKYKNRALVLESQASNYDIFLTPRDTARVRLYYSTLLKEYPKLDPEKIKSIKDRLKQNHLSFDEYINFQLQSK
jgi:hypothetical protein